MINKKVILISMLLLNATIIWCSNPGKVDSLNDISYDIANTFLDSAFVIALKAYDLAKKEKYLEGEMTSLCRIGRVHLKKGQLDSCLFYFNLAEEIFDPYRADSVFLVKALIYQGITLNELGNIDEAIQIYAKSFDIALARQDTLYCGQSLINISNLYKSKGDYEGALKSLHKAFEYIDPTNVEYIGSIHNNIGNIFQLQGRIEDALNSFNKAYDNYTEASNLYNTTNVLVNLGNIYLEEMLLDSANYYYEQALSIANENGYELLKSQIYHNKGEYHFFKNEREESKQCFATSLKLNRAQKGTKGLSRTLERYGDLLRLDDDLKECLPYYLESYTISEMSNDYLQLRDISGKISDLYLTRKEDAKAVKYLQISKQYQDSINQELQESLTYELQYNNEKHKVEKLSLELKNQKKILDKQIAINRLYLVLGLLFLIAVILLVRYINSKRKKVEAENKNITFQQEIEGLLSNQDKITIKAMLDGQETERNKIADELHNKLGNILSMVKLYFKSIDKQIEKLKLENIEQYKLANDLLDEACDEVRKTAHALSTGYLSKFGLFKAIKRLTEKIEGSGELKVILTTHGADEDIKELNEISIYRIVQEIISNTLKYAKASEINIQLNVFDEIFNLLIEDNGVGFNPDILKDHNGMGLDDIKAKVKNMNGIFQLDTKEGQGTNISIDIPINRKK